MQNYIREHSVGGIVRGAFQIYFRNFLPITIVFFIPTLPFLILQAVGTVQESDELIVFSTGFGMIANLFAAAAITLLISDVCLGNKINISRYIRRVFGTLVAKIFLTNMLQVLAIMIGFVLLIVPGLLALIWLMFCATIVVIEGTWGLKALKRSKELGNTKHWRNAGVFSIMLVVVVVAGAISGFLFGMIAPDQIEGLSFQIFIVVLQHLFVPPSLIAIVLMYYDLRVRKEAYNLDALVEDLKY